MTIFSMSLLAAGPTTALKKDLFKKASLIINNILKTVVGRLTNNKIVK